MFNVCVCGTHIVTVQHSEEFWVRDELDRRRLEEIAHFLMIDRGGGACRQWDTKYIYNKHLLVLQMKVLVCSSVSTKPVPGGAESESVSVLLLRSNLWPPPSSSVAMVLWMLWYLQKHEGWRDFWRRFYKTSLKFPVLHFRMLLWCMSFTLNWFKYNIVDKQRLLNSIFSQQMSASPHRSCYCAALHTLLTQLLPVTL